MTSCLDLATEIPAPDYHHTAQSVTSFYKDPYLYYGIYVANPQLFPHPPVIRHTTEMLYKYELLYGQEAFDKRFDTRAPINPQTKKAYGDDTDKFINWAKTVKQDGKLPVHPGKAESAHTIFEHTMKQAELGFLDPLPRFVNATGHIGYQAIANIDESNCYAHVDKLSDDGVICRTQVIYNLDRLQDHLYTEMVLPTVFQWCVLKEAGKAVADNALLIIAESQIPYRTAVISIDPSKTANTLIAIIQELNMALSSNDRSVWRSKFHANGELAQIIKLRAA